MCAMSEQIKYDTLNEEMSASKPLFLTITFRPVLEFFQAGLFSLFQLLSQ